MPFSDMAGRSVQRLSSPSLDPLPSKIIPFFVLRNIDLHGNSGRGIVAEGVIFSSGRCVMTWLDQIASINIFQSVDEMMAIHGHGGKTVIFLWQ